MSIRKIIHIDMDAFFASVEQRDNPSLAGKPIAVGGQSHRSVIATASYEARVFGVRSAMPTVKARQLCPELVIVPGRMAVYREVSEQIRAVFKHYTDIIEPLSLDEAYLDVTENKTSQRYATRIAQSILKKITKDTHLTASAGISYNKFLAKMASDINKPNGFYVIRPEQAARFLESLPIEKFHGIGRSTAGKMHGLGITDGLSLKAASKVLLVQEFGRRGQFFYDIVRGHDPREVKTSRLRKSIGAERTFNENRQGINALEQELIPLVAKLAERMKAAQLLGQTLSLKLKTADFQIHSRSITLEQNLETEEALHYWAKQLLQRLIQEHCMYRLVGLQLSNFKNVSAENQQMPLLFDE
ncbi:MAG: DNA polymerase IV [Pseudomonadota bacterium]|nr:DNA polymerase IV [Pseudomonadota bacterium]